MIVEVTGTAPSSSKGTSFRQTNKKCTEKYYLFLRHFCKISSSSGTNKGINFPSLSKTVVLQLKKKKGKKPTKKHKT